MLLHQDLHLSKLNPFLSGFPHLAIPSAQDLEKFETLVSPLYRAVQENNIQSAKLAELRDTLLPKLMSGELDVAHIRF